MDKFIYDNDAEKDREQLFHYLNIKDVDSDGIADEEVIEEGEILSDGLLDDIDFSAYSGDFKKSFRKVRRKSEIKSVKVPTDRTTIVEGQSEPPKQLRKRKRPAQQVKKAKAVRKRSKRRRPEPRKKGIGVKQSVDLKGRGRKKISKIEVPRDRKVVVEGVNGFILSDDKDANFIKNIKYYKGEKLEELIFTFNNNDSALDFEFELFNPSMPLDYLQSTGLNLNDKISVNGSDETKYSDILASILANPTMLINAQFVFSGAQLTQQINQPIKYLNKSIEAVGVLDPQQISLQIDRYQFQNNVVYFNIAEEINRPFCPDGLDIMKYKILAGMTVTFAFYVKQVLTKKVYFPEARRSKTLI